MQQDEISRVSIILGILILYQVPSFSFGVITLESPPFPCSNLLVKCKMSGSSIIHEQRSCMAKGNVVESEILCTLSKWACNLTESSSKLAIIKEFILLICAPHIDLKVSPVP
jgi:hypothetical protein